MTNLVSQAGQMITYGIPNDAIPSMNPICVLVVVPVLERLVYPYMQKVGVSPRPTVRMTLGFGLMAVTMAIAAGAQQVVYDAPPCYDMPLECPASDNGKITNQASVLLQLPIYVVGALGEMLFSVSGSEYAYNKAPANMKSTLQAVTMFTVALGSGLGIAMSPVAHNPHLVILFSSLTAVITITTIAFGWVFWSRN
jgi:POT family proton-dependent oligopeptide transporter